MQPEISRQYVYQLYHLGHAPQVSKQGGWKLLCHQTKCDLSPQMKVSTTARRRGPLSYTDSGHFPG